MTIFVWACVLGIILLFLNISLDGLRATAKLYNRYVGGLALSVAKKLGHDIAPAMINLDPRLLDIRLSSGHEEQLKALSTYSGSFVPTKPIRAPIWTKPAALAVHQYDPSAATSISIESLSEILTPSPSIRASLENALAQIKPFPEAAPVKGVAVKPPPEVPVIVPASDIEQPSIYIPLYNGWLSFLNGFVTAQYADQVKQVQVATKNRLTLLEFEQTRAAEFQAASEKAKAIYEKLHKQQELDYEEQHLRWRNVKEAWETEAEKDRANIQEELDLLASGDLDSMAAILFKYLKLPRWVPSEYEIGYDPEADIVILEHELPDVGAVVWQKFVEQKAGYVRKPANQKESKQAAELLYPTLALKLSYEIATQLNLSDQKAIVFNGWSNFVVKATGNQKRAYCVALMSKVNQLKELNLAQLDPLVAFGSLKGVAAKTLELTPIAPAITINMNDPRFVDNKEIVGKLSSEQNLASMDWEDFEHLCRELFERVFASNGAEVKVTQASRDQGVDAVIMDPDPIRGGKMVVQAKRYVNTVDVSAVRDLYGTMMNEGAMKGILVCTSQFGQESYAFIQGKPLTLINGNELLGLLEQHGYKFRIDLEEARKMMKDAGTTVAGRNKYAGVSHFKNEDL
ncbi:restriction endonuclease [Polynucleobacter sp. Ross1-W9]|nr:restriction endonuclease [Polynucleobacter parvulilacunae]